MRWLSGFCRGPRWGSLQRSMFPQTPVAENRLHLNFELTVLVCHY